MDLAATTAMQSRSPTWVVCHEHIAREGGVEPYRKGGQASRGQNSGAGLKPPQAAVVKSDGGERCGESRELGGCQERGLWGCRRTGFSSRFSDWVSDRTDAKETREFALAHIKRGVPGLPLGNTYKKWRCLRSNGRTVVPIAYVPFDGDCNWIACWKRPNERFIQQLIQVLGFIGIFG